MTPIRAAVVNKYTTLMLGTDDMERQEFAVNPCLIQTACL